MIKGILSMNQLACSVALIALSTGIIIMFNAVKKNKSNNTKMTILFTIGILISTLSIPIIVNELYMYGYKTGKGYIILWEAKDVLYFYGSFLAFAGTVSLGALALYQNQKFKSENDIAQLKIEKINNKPELFMKLTTKVLNTA